MVLRPAHLPQGVPLLPLDHTVGHGHVLYARTRVYPSLARTRYPSVCTRCSHRPSAAPSALQALCISLLQRASRASVPPQPKPPHPAARRPARATPGGNFRQGPYPTKLRWRDCARLWAIPLAGKMRAKAVSATRGRRGSLPYPTISRGSRTARTIATSCGCCIGPRISTSSRRSAPALGHRKHGEGSYPLSTHRHTCDSTSPSGSHSTCTAIGYAPTVQMCFIFPIRVVAVSPLTTAAASSPGLARLCHHALSVDDRRNRHP
jgi:hypothetical protein